MKRDTPLPALEVIYMEWSGGDPIVGIVRSGSRLVGADHIGRFSIKRGGVSRDPIIGGAGKECVEFHHLHLILYISKFLHHGKKLMCQSLKPIEQLSPLVHYEPISWGVNITPLCHCRGEGRYLTIFIAIVFNGFLKMSNI